jgi:PAS domain S-box-containing protein/putative nucleotidyltransferase with HDIG domain
MKVSSYKKGMFDIPTVMLLSLDRLGNISFINKKGCEILGYSKEEIVGLNWFDHFIKEEMRKEVKDIFFQLLSGKSELVEYYENSVITKTGEERMISFHNAIVYNDGNDEVVGVFSSGNDITEAVEATERLEISKLQFSLLAKNLNAGLVIHALDTSITFCNEKALNLLGLNREQALDNKANSPSWTFIREDGSPMPFDEYPVNVVLSSNKNLNNYTVGIVIPDKKYPNWVLCNAFPSTNIDGEEEVIVTFVDITEHKQAEEALRESLGKLAEAERIGHMGSWEFDIITDTGTFSDETYRIFGVGEDYGGSFKSFLNLVHPDDRGLVKLANQKAIESGNFAKVQYRIKRPDGSVRFAQCDGEAQKDESGRVTKLFGSIQDITERKQADYIIESDRTATHAMINNLPFLAWMKDKESRFLLVNENFVSSCGASDASWLVGKTDLDIWPKELGEAYRADDQEVMASRRSKMVEESIVVVDSPKWFETFKSPLFDANEDVVGTVGMARDITDRKQADDALSQSAEKVKKGLVGTIVAMSKMVEARDPYTAGHQLNVAKLSKAIAQEMGLDSDQIEGIRTGATIHDIGKIHLPAEILSKPTKLTEIEFELVKTHCQIGYDILKDIEFPWLVADIAYQHHERLDGSGYPQGLKGDEICLEARIVAVADVVEAMSSHRPYRPSLGIDAALEEIQAHKGSLYDKEAVDICVTLFNEKKFSL